jgi:ATP/maltotriose-dependent transcriptional regulator MalT
MLEAYSVAWLNEVYQAQGDYETAAAVGSAVTTRLSRSLDECRERWVQLGLANLALACQDPDRARHILDEVVSLVQEWGIPYISAGYNTILGRLCIETGDLDGARPLVDDVVAMAGQVGSPWLLAGSHNLSGRLCRAAGDAAGAEDHHQRALAVAAESGLAGVAAEALECVASLAADGESWAEAARLFGAASALREVTGQQRWPLDQPRHDADLARLREALGDDGFARAHTEGTGLSLQEAVAYAARARGERKRRSTGWEALTRTELEVVALAAQGLTNAEIGARLFITAGTAKVHLSNIFRKLGVANRAQLAAMATTRTAAES